VYLPGADISRTTGNHCISTATFLAIATFQDSITTTRSSLQ
jgi:hypothetical protein